MEETKNRFIICKSCKTMVRVTPQQSHYITLCKKCYIKSQYTGKCPFSEDE